MTFAVYKYDSIHKLQWLIPRNIKRKEKCKNVSENTGEGKNWTVHFMMPVLLWNQKHKDIRKQPTD